MHIPDGFLDPKISGGLLGAAVGVLGYCLGKVLKAVTAVVPQRVLATVGNGIGNIGMAGKRILTKIGEKKLYQMGIVAAWIFSAQMFNFPINSGTSGHLIGGVFAGVLLGPFAGTVVIAVVLIVQSLFFADGGFMALGANITNMAVFGTFVSYYIYALLKKYVSELASIAIAAWFSVVLAAFACSLEVGLSGTIALSSVTIAMMKVHFIIGIAEAVLTVLLLKLFNRENIHK
ncbi:MAG: energy-coupling factor ABC transporter permease [Elusimicrobia bacterium]|nr:energy-coupling factor ABC transporter permease [Elusimicrobiota bacterium]